MIHKSILEIEHITVVNTLTHSRNSLSLTSKNMPIEVAKTISVDARNTLIRRRDELQSRHGIKMFFPKNRVRGATQDMVLKGGPNAIARAERDIDTILIAWNDEFQAFKQRQAHRKESRRLQNQQPPPQLPSTTTKSSSTNTFKNRFSALEATDTTTTASAAVEVPVTKPKQPTLKGWAAMAAKPAPKPKELPKATMPRKFTFGTTGSGAAFTYMEEPEHFDWAEEDDSQYSPVSSPFFEDGCVNTW